VFPIYFSGLSVLEIGVWAHFFDIVNLSVKALSIAVKVLKEQCH